MPLIDGDKDGLSDSLEREFHTDPLVADSDGDSFPDGLEVQNGFDPMNALPKRLIKKIEIELKGQRLHYLLGSVHLGEMKISSGKKGMQTPKGIFHILNKAPRAWSASAGLWMPNWLGFAYGGKIGIHELPEWPNGRKEGADHLGKPVSHGCVRLGVKDSRFLYSWAEVGTEVIVK